jgi:hypothetical protein
MSKVTKVYLAGPMSGKPEFNFPAFFQGADFLRGEGYEVFSPAEHDMEVVASEDTDFWKGNDGTVVPDGLSYRSCLKADLTWICDNAEGMFLLPGWENSKGVGAEVALAKCLGIPIWELHGLDSPTPYYKGIYYG